MSTARDCDKSSLGTKKLFSLVSSLDCHKRLNSDKKHSERMECTYLSLVRAFHYITYRDEKSETCDINSSYLS